MINFVTSNGHKFREISGAMGAFGIEVSWVKMKYEEIQADRTEEVSLDSAKKLAGKIEAPFFLEDTGLYIEQLGGFPGPYSSYVFRTIGNEGILKLMGKDNRRAKFLTIITYHAGEEFHQFPGSLEGRISTEIRGQNRFGYDPIFIPQGQDRTLGEMSVDEKNSLSHRSKAVSLLMDFIS